MGCSMSFALLCIVLRFVLDANLAANRVSPGLKLLTGEDIQTWVYICILFFEIHTGAKILNLSKKSRFENLTFHKVHISKCHFWQNSQLQNVTFDKIHNFKVSFYTKFTFQNHIFHKIHFFKISFFTKFTIAKSHFDKIHI